MKALVTVKTKLLKPCKNFIQICKSKFKLRKPVFITSLKLRRPKRKPRKSPQRNRISALLSGFRPIKQQSRRHMDRLAEELSLKSMSENPGHDQILFPSPITPNYYFTNAYGSSSKRDDYRDEDVDDACRSFENYLVEMIVEEGKVGDLTDIEELLYCWKNLKSPVFIDLVCRFYGELCKDLFFPDPEEDDHGEEEDNHKKC